mmetsp:Transcript_25539/g.38119  ORF Transcript_25539/g.38119 Transcript_25539/m.38119 type:complete len:385 (+) Transcript_25539:361-1515(+)
MDIEESSKFSANIFKVPCLESVPSLSGISMHRVTDPEDTLSFTLNGADQARQIRAQFLSSHADDNGKTSRNILRVHGINDSDQFFGRALVRNLDSQRIVDTTSEFQVSAVQITCTLSNPEHVGAAIVPLARCRILSGQSLLVFQKQTFVCSEKINLSEFWRTSVDADRFHETKRLVNLGSEFAVPASLIRTLHKIKVPSMQPADISVSSSTECTQDVERLCTLMVGLDHLARIVSAGLLVKGFRVDNISTVGWKSNTVLHLIGLRTRLGKLTGHATNLDHWHGRTESHNKRHLQNHTEGIPHMIDIEFFETFSTISTHEQEPLPLSSASKLFMQSPDFTCKHKGGTASNSIGGTLQFSSVFVHRHLLGNFFTPTLGRPFFGIRG